MSVRQSRAHVRVLITVGTLLTFMLASVGSAYAANQGGRRTRNETNFEGTSANLTPHSFNPDSGHCVLQSVLAYDFSADRQLETGSVRCDGATIDGTCHSGYHFVETYANNVYTCFQHSSFNNGDTSTFWVDRSSSQSGTFYAHIDGYTRESQGGFTPGTNVRGIAWMERAGSGTGCSGWGPAHGTFHDWQSTFGTNNWQYSTGSIYNPTGCWAVSTISSTGDFDVTK